MFYWTQVSCGIGLDSNLARFIYFLHKHKSNLSLNSSPMQHWTHIHCCFGLKSNVSLNSSSMLHWTQVQCYIVLSENIRITTNKQMWNWHTFKNDAVSQGLDDSNQKQIFTFQIRMTDKNNNADFNSETLIAASEEAVKNGVLYMLLVLTSEGNLEVKDSMSMAESLKEKKKKWLD